MNIKEEIAKGKSIYELPLRVTYYARVSTESDSQNTSIINQVTYFNDFINRNPLWKKINGYIDEGISGKAIKNRSNFQKMIYDGINNKYDLILTKSVSRFARNTIDSIKYTDILKNKGIGVIFLNDNINTLNNDSEFRLTLMASIAQDEIRKLSESVKFGLKQSIDRGVVLGNSNILGYKKNKGKLVIVKEEAQIVKELFKLFSTNNYTYSKLATLINQKYNKKFDSTSIKRILINYKYKGYYCGRKSTVINYKNSQRKNISKDKWVIYKDYNKVPCIVDEELWNKVNNIIKKRTIKRHKKTSIYKNKVICGIHNKKYKYITKKYKNKYYNYFICSKCNSINEKIINTICQNTNIEKIIIYKYNNILKLVLKINN